jgi:hypothetical protein
MPFSTYNSHCTAHHSVLWSYGARLTYYPPSQGLLPRWFEHRGGACSSQTLPTTQGDKFVVLRSPTNAYMEDLECLVDTFLTVCRVRVQERSTNSHYKPYEISSTHFCCFTYPQLRQEPLLSARPLHGALLRPRTPESLDWGIIFASSALLSPPPGPQYPSERILIADRHGSRGQYLAPRLRQPSRHLPSTGSP